MLLAPNGSHTTVRGLAFLNSYQGMHKLLFRNRGPAPELSLLRDKQRPCIWLFQSP